MIDLEDLATIRDVPRGIQAGFAASRIRANEKARRNGSVIGGELTASEARRRAIPDGVFVSRSGVLAVTKDGISLPYVSILGVPA